MWQGFLPDENALQLTREETQYRCPLFGDIQHQANISQLHLLSSPLQQIVSFQSIETDAHLD